MCHQSNEVYILLGSPSPSSLWQRVATFCIYFFLEHMIKLSDVRIILLWKPS